MLATEIHEKINQEISGKIIGKSAETRLLTIALLAQGHAIIEGVPGIAKTLLAKSFAIQHVSFIMRHPPFISYH